MGGKISIDWDHTFFIYSLGPPASLIFFPTPPLNFKGGVNFQKLKNDQNSKETIKLTQIHGTWYVYSIGTPTPLKTKKKSKKYPPPPFLGRRSISAPTTFR